MKTHASVLREAAQMCRERSDRLLNCPEASAATEAQIIAARLEIMARQESASPHPILAILRDMASADNGTLSDARWVRGRVALMLETMEGGKCSR